MKIEFNSTHKVIKDIFVAYGFSEEELQYARQTRHKLKGLYEGANQISKASAQQFAQTCEAYFKDKK